MALEGGGAIPIRSNWITYKKGTFLSVHLRYVIPGQQYPRLTGHLETLILHRLVTFQTEDWALSSFGATSHGEQTS